MQVGRWQVSAVLEGTFGLDGGSMFGIVPRPLWSRRHIPDGRNRISMALRPMLLRGEHGRLILVDAGIGLRFDEKQQAIYNYQTRFGGIAGALDRLGVKAEQITDVVATHLHFDHVAGLLTREADGVLRPTFPRARIHLQEEAWEHARLPSQWDQGSYFAGDFAIWEREMDLVLLRGDTEIADGVRSQVTCGHTPGHQIVLVGEGQGSLVYCADLIPTGLHVKLPYIMAYDQFPLTTLDEKKVLLAQAIEEDWILVFEHDPLTACCKLVERDDQVEAGQELCLNACAPADPP
jgi:glyoxylase-like metal-dependent hydrolase (beta-lactamase superfamily II)